MRARRAETPARPRRRCGVARALGATAARRSWPQSYRGLLRAQPGPERSGGTRPTQQLQFAGRRSRTPSSNLASEERLQHLERHADPLRAVDQRVVVRAAVDVEVEVDLAPL